MSLAWDIAHWAWPQWTMVSLSGFTALLNALLDGKPRTGNYSAGVALVGAALGLFILTAGGFYG